MLFHQFDTKNINLLSFAYQNYCQKNLSYGEKLTCQRSWANEHPLLLKIFWQNVLLSNETTLELHPNKRVLVRRLPNTGMEKKNLSENQKIWWKKLILRGFIAHDGPKCLQKVCGTIKSIKYLQILQESLLSEIFWAKNCSRIMLLHIIRSF